MTAAAASPKTRELSGECAWEYSGTSRRHLVAGVDRRREFVHRAF